jgi:hypothetical protein
MSLEAGASPKADLHIHEGEIGRLASASNALGAQMLYHRPEGAALHTVSSGLKEISEAFFREGWHINNSREVRARARRVGLQEVITESDLFTPEELDRDAFQREFLDRFGLRWFSSFGAIHFDQISPVVLTLERAIRQRPRGGLLGTVRKRPY